MEERKSSPTWAYKDGEGKIFDHPDDVPTGWSDTPAKPDAPKRGRPRITPESND